MALALASSPAIASLFERWRDEPVHRYSLLACLLLALLATSTVRASATAPRPGLGWFLLAGGLAIQLVGAASAAGFVAQFGMASCIVGLGLVLGRPSPAFLLLSFGIVPLPAFLHGFASPHAEGALGEAAGWLLAGFGASVDAGGPLLTSGGRRFELLGSDAGIVSAVCAAQYAWYEGVRRGLTLGLLIRRVFAASALAIAFQPVLVLLCAATLPLGLPGQGRFVLSYGVPLGLGMLALARGIGARVRSAP